MKIWIVSESDYDMYEQHGVFSTEEKAQAYIDMVAAASKAVGKASYLDLDECDVDELADRRPVFAITLSNLRSLKKEESVVYRSRMPKTELHGDPIYSVKIFGHDLQQLRERVPEVRKEYFGK